MIKNLIKNINIVIIVFAVMNFGFIVVIEVILDAINFL